MATMPHPMPPLTASEERVLLALARLALERGVRDGVCLSWPPPGTDVSPRLLVPQGAFVSLHSGPQLRGCVGFIEPQRPLVSAVMENAVSAAVRDFRFPPVTAAELAAITIEISAMGLLAAVEPDAVAVGVHGLVIEHGERRGLLLPQVATEHRWDRETFLRQLCHKAGLPEDAWQLGDSKLFAFTAQVFAESPAGSPPAGG